MPSFAIVNLLEVEDSVGDRVPEMEGRFARKHLDSRDLGVSHFRYDANFRSPMAHSHREQEEAYVVASGSGRILLDGDVRELRQWDVVRVAPEVVRVPSSGSRSFSRNGTPVKGPSGRPLPICRCAYS